MIPQETMTTQTEEVVAREGAGSNIPPHPSGQFPMRCIDLIDHGVVETTWKGTAKKRHRISLRFWGGQYGEGAEGKKIPLWVDAWFTLSLNEKAALRPFLQAWRGRPFNDEELKGFNVAVLVGVDALVQLSHNRTADRTYCNIDSIMRLPKGMEGPGNLEGYVRVKDRPTDGDNGAHSSDPDDDMPF